ncbi:hypothetical protein ACFOOM_10080 [Streptomyces echinoruber]|uniref:Uncharacterized protein n=1 Tax=Streptomyces echinoruber TaxID=68898 RepID=A0A918VS55_9ACTN|nr:hypothetical protein [Streptomyces echinoruber]GHA19703.1 hypothetical protein GCM10010389_66500 [Streptomyces echinoruber]
MTGRAHITAAAGDPAPRRRHAEQTGYVSPAYLRWAEQVEQAARPPADSFQMPTTAAELDAMSYADRVRVFTTDRALYDRLTGRAPA